MLDRLKRKFFRAADARPADSQPADSHSADSSPGRFPAHRFRAGRARIEVFGHWIRSGLAGRHRRLAEEVIRHRIRSGLAGRHRRLAVVALAVALVGAASLAANAAVSDPAPAETAGPDTAALADRAAAAERADRAQRQDLAEIEAGERRAAGPEQSPTPTPTESADEADEESAESQPEPEPEPEPAQAEEEESQPEPAPDWVHPMPGAATTSCYGMRGGAMHAGVDLASPPGTPIRSVGAGTVTNAGWVFGGYGISVVIDHGNGFLTHYAHASEATVSVGQSVSPGQTIALEGSTGDSSGPHLHFEVHSGMWNQIEPASWLRGQGISFGGC